MLAWSLAGGIICWLIMFSMFDVWARCAANGTTGGWAAPSSDGSVVCTWVATASSVIRESAASGWRVPKWAGAPAAPEEGVFFF